MRQKIFDLEELLKKQQKDETLWFKVETVSEAYLQHAIKQLHIKSSDVILELILKNLYNG